MIPEERLGKWVAIGVPLFLVVGIAGTVVIHMGYAVPWRHLLIPVSLFVGLQIGFYVGAFWAGKWARQQSRYWPMSILVGLYLWGTSLILMRYGARWGILPSYGDYFSFSVCMALVMVIAWFLALRFGKKACGGGPRQDK